jgi:serine/threonine protein kinase
MEYVDGESLADRRLREPGKCFDVEQIAPWIDQLCQALTYAHDPKRRVIHRDLKPGNLLISKDGELKVADFGMACSLVTSFRRVADGVQGGTPPFMSPQQLRGDTPSESDDVYSLGATIYALLTGKPPFHQGDIVDQVKHKAPESMSERRARLNITARAAIAPAWEETVAACLAKDAGQRPVSVDSVALRLDVRGLKPAPATPPAREAIRVDELRLDHLQTLPTQPAPAGMEPPEYLRVPTAPLPPPLVAAKAQSRSSTTSFAVLWECLRWFGIAVFTALAFSAFAFGVLFLLSTTENKAIAYSFSFVSFFIGAGLTWVAYRGIRRGRR